MERLGFMGGIFLGWGGFFLLCLRAIGLVG